MRKLAALLLGTSLLAFASQANAALISFYSGDGGDSVVPGAVTAITPHPLWGDVSDDAGLSAGTASWISYANTGIGGFVAPNTANRFDTAAATATFTRTFAIGTNGSFDLFILADDTARVELAGPGIANTLLEAVFAGQIDPCAPGGTGQPIGCVEADMGVYNLTGLTGGTYTLTVYAYQTNNDVFGVQYAGAYTAVPEPMTLALVGAGVLGLGVAARRRRTA